MSMELENPRKIKGGINAVRKTYEDLIQPEYWSQAPGSVGVSRDTEKICTMRAGLGLLGVYTLGIFTGARLR
jgi:hypothetical protein